MRRRESGVALITVLLVVALATIAAVQMTAQGQYDRRRTANRLALEQAHEVALGGERWAVAVLARDRRGKGADLQQQSIRDKQGGNANVDSRDEAWAQTLPPIPIEGGQVAGNIEDAQGRFNVNSLLDAQGSVDAVALARFERLLQSAGVDRRVANAVIDWLDADAETTYPAGAEDDFYAGLERPYRAANTGMATASELRLVRGIDAQVWAALAPAVTALPGSTPINVNTAKPAVLAAIVPGLEPEAAEQIVEQVADKPFDSVQQFLESPLVKGKDVPADGLAVRSSHFRVRVDVEMGPLTYTLYSWLQRADNGRSRVLRRSRTPN